MPTVVVPYAPGIAALKVIARNYLTDIAEEVKDAAKTLVPVRTGNLKNSIVRYPAGTDTERIHAMAHYAAYVELGTRPHEIRPNSKSALYWTGRAYPVSRVQHPGATANPYLRPALSWVAAAHT